MSFSKINRAFVGAYLNPEFTNLKYLKKDNKDG